MKIVLKYFFFVALWYLLAIAAWRSAGAQEQIWTGIVVHWSDSAEMSLDQCNEWHNARGWDGCGYNYIIQRSGEIVPARGFDRVGAHTKGYNSQFLGVCFVGNTAPTAAQLEAWRGLKIKLFQKLGEIPIFTHAALGHTECPGPALKILIENKEI